MLLGFIKKLAVSNSTNEDLRRREYILNILLLGAIALLIVACFNNTIQVIFGPSNDDGILSVYILYGLLSFFLALLFLSHKGHSLISAFTFLFLILSLAFYMNILWGVELPASLLFYCLVIVMSGVLVSAKASFIVTILIFLGLAGLNHLQISGELSSNLDWIHMRWSLSTVIVTSLIFTLIALVSWLSNREIERSLKRARKSEQELKTQRDNLEEQVIARTKELKEIRTEKMLELNRLAEFGRLSSGFFHEFSNSLTIISLSIENLQIEHGEQMKDTKPQLKKLIDTSRQMEHFLLSIKERLVTKVDKRLIQVKSEIEEVMSALAYKARKANVELVHNCKDKVSFYGDAVKFNQVILNLVINAIDSYNDEHKKRQVNIKTSKRNKNLVIEIKDWGKGISKENLEKIFEAFYTTKDFKEGSGLGLSLVKNIVEHDYNGSISVRSKMGDSTIFKVIIPI